MRLSVLKNIKDMHKFLDYLEAGVKTRKADRIYPAYMFLKTLVYHMNEGDLTPDALDLAQELLHRDYLKDRNETGYDAGN
jgi:hypothetical protein